MIMILMIAPVIQPITTTLPQGAEIQTEAGEGNPPKPLPPKHNLSNRNAPGDSSFRVHFLYP